LKKKNYYVYLLISKKDNHIKSYVGYTNNLKKRINKHNSNKGAKSTRGRFWILGYKRKFISKSKAMKFEYILKKNRKFRNKIKDIYV
tara:strand:+ start:860 stop:1120 length:261 start_codon:yes stop_codon:yes gene_type:complete